MKRRDVSGTRGRGERAAGVGGRVTGRDGGVGAWGVLMISGAGGYRDGWWKDGREVLLTFNNSLRAGCGQQKGIEIFA